MQGHSAWIRCLLILTLSQVTPEKLMSADFKQYLDILAEQNELSRLVVDEVSIFLRGC